MVNHPLLNELIKHPDVVAAVVRTVRPAIGDRAIGVLEHPTRTTAKGPACHRYGDTPLSQLWLGNCCL